MGPLSSFSLTSISEPRVLTTVPWGELLCCPPQSIHKPKPSVCRLPSIQNKSGPLIPQQPLMAPVGFRRKSRLLSWASVTLCDVAPHCLSSVSFPSVHLFPVFSQNAGLPGRPHAMRGCAPHTSVQSFYSDCSFWPTVQLSKIIPLPQVG